MTTSQDLIDRARYYIGTPYHHQGRNRERGLDCAGLVVVALQDLGFDVTDLEGYSRIPNAERLRGIVELNFGGSKPTTDIKPGDVLLLRFSTQPQHLAIYTEKNTLIHSYMKKGCVVEQRFSDIWLKRVLGVYSVF